MSRYVSYIATRSLRATSVEGALYTLDLDNQLRTCTPGTRNVKTVKRSISNRVHQSFQHQRDVWSCASIGVAGAVAEQFFEFLRSAADQQFQFAPGSEFDGGANPSTAFTVIIPSADFDAPMELVAPGEHRFRFSWTMERVG